MRSGMYIVRAEADQIEKIVDMLEEITIDL